MKKPLIFSVLRRTIQTLENEQVSSDRKAILQPLINYIQMKHDRQETANLNFICTHNSRRSQMSQIWAQTAAYYHHVDAQCYSGGVEVTAFNEKAVASVQRAGFKVARQSEEENPMYAVLLAEDAEPVQAFSKLYDDPTNAVSPFAAIMTCAHADEHCPFIAGAEARIPIRYEDPKAFDDTPQEAEQYDACARKIAAEMFYVFANIR